MITILLILLVCGAIGGGISISSLRLKPGRMILVSKTDGSHVHGQVLSHVGTEVTFQLQDGSYGSVHRSFVKPL
jgi:hypothetical protein